MVTLVIPFREALQPSEGMPVAMCRRAWTQGVINIGHMERRLSYLHEECVLEEAQIGVITGKGVVPPEEQWIVLSNHLVHRVVAQDPVLDSTWTGETDPVLKHSREAHSGSSQLYVGGHSRRPQSGWWNPLVALSAVSPGLNECQEPISN